MQIVVDIGDSAADVPAVLAAMDGPGLELVGVDGSHVGCRIAGIVEGENSGKAEGERMSWATGRFGSPWERQPEIDARLDGT